MARSRLLITAALLCHLLLCPRLVTSQLLRPARPGEAGEEVTIKAKQQEQKGDVFTLRGDVEITLRRYVLKADEITYDKATGLVVATGHVVFNGGPHDEHLQATRAVYNVNTDHGDFYDVVGTTGAK